MAINLRRYIRSKVEVTLVGGHTGVGKLEVGVENDLPVFKLEECLMSDPSGHFHGTEKRTYEINPDYVTSIAIVP